MGASDVVKLSAGADSVRPAGGMQQVAQLMGGPGAQGMRPLPEAVQHKGGPGAQVMEPLTEAERMHMIWLGQQKQQKQLQAHQQEGEPLAEGMILVDKEEQAKENYDQTICDDSSQQVPNLHAVPHAPQSAIPGLPKMFMQMPTYNKVGQVPSRRQQAESSLEVNRSGEQMEC
eukprot:gene22519-29640_t